MGAGTGTQVVPLWGRKGPIRDDPALFQMLLGGHREEEDFFQVIQYIISVENPIFHGRSTDLASTSQFTAVFSLAGAQQRPQQLLATSQHIWGSLPFVFVSFHCLLCYYYFSVQRCCTSRKEITAGSKQHNHPSLQLSAGKSPERSGKPACNSLYPFSVILYYHPPC